MNKTGQVSKMQQEDLNLGPGPGPSVLSTVLLGPKVSIDGMAHCLLTQ